ncbi:MAG: hypothetical protein MUF15_01080 [Acidobacteria bacterium]|jgi:hypothetical protein|nr:hypothetical protein [Acidobacteriota bacterium]
MALNKHGNFLAWHLNYYRGVGDNIFDKVFRGVYEEEIREFDIKVIKKEYDEAFEKLKKDHDILRGKFNSQKGYFAEYVVLDQLKYRVRKNNLINVCNFNRHGQWQ